MEKIKASHKDEYIEKLAELYDRDPDLEHEIYDNPDEDAYHEARRKSHPEEYTTQDWDKLAKESPDGIPF